MSNLSPAVAFPGAGETEGDPAGAFAGTISLLKANALAGIRQPVLRGRNIGLLCEEPQRPEVFLLQRAATDLGARVALVDSGLIEDDDLVAVEEAGRVLGRLYDALICIDVPARIVERLRQAAGVPAIANLTGEWIALRAVHPDADDDGRCLLQALLVAICD